MLNGLDLFSGIGGISLALEPWVRPVAYCENERYAQAVLLSRMRDGGLPVAPIWDDVRTLNGSDLPPIDIIYGGFPCQDISSAGRGAGMEQGDRSGLFFEIMRLTQEIRPTFVFLENVPAIRTRGLSRVLSEFTALGYDCRWKIVSAADVGAPHLRKRWFLLAADSNSETMLWAEKQRSESHRTPERRKALADAYGFTERKQSGRRSGQSGQGPSIDGDHGSADVPDSTNDGDGRGIPFERSGQEEGHVADTDGGRRNERWSEPEIRQGKPNPFWNGWWKSEPNLGGMVDGLSARMDSGGVLDNAEEEAGGEKGPVPRVTIGTPNRVGRLRGLGNAVVPLQARVAFQRLMGL